MSCCGSAAAQQGALRFPVVQCYAVFNVCSLGVDDWQLRRGAVCLFVDQ